MEEVKKRLMDMTCNFADSLHYLSFPVAKSSEMSRSLSVMGLNNIVKSPTTTREKPQVVDGYV